MQHDSEAGLSAWSTELDMRLNDASLSPAYRRRGRRKRLGRLCSLDVVGRTQSFSSADFVVLLGDFYKDTFACHLEWSHAADSLELV